MAPTAVLAVFFTSHRKKRPLTTQDILEHEDSFDCGGDAGDIVMGVQGDSFVPRRIRKKQPRPDGTRLPFFHHFFARTVLTAEEQQIIDDINAFGLCRLLHQWASGLLEYAQSAVQEELRTRLVKAYILLVQLIDPENENSCK